MEEIRLEDWAVVGVGNSSLYDSPECKTLHLSGAVYGHPHFQDGARIVTSNIMHADGREVSTVNRKYFLGKISQSYKDWYEKNHKKPINEDSPFPDH